MFPNTIADTMYDEEIDVRDAEDVDDSESTESSIDNDSSRDLRTPSAKQRKLLMSSSGSGRRSRSRLRAVDHVHRDDEHPDGPELHKEEDDPDNYDVHEAQRDYNKEVDFLHLPQDVKEVFKYIQMYYPQKTKLEYKLSPFIPDYLPAVGDADAFIKVVAPDPSVQAGLGLEYLDEPGINQSDPCLLNLQLRASSSSSSKSLVVKKLENAEKNPKVVEQWIRDINELNRGKASTFFYSTKMPDVEMIKKPWTVGEQRTKKMPDFENDNLLTVIDDVCDYFGIPKTVTKVESLHLLFSVYATARNSSAQNTTTVLPPQRPPSDDTSVHSDDGDDNDGHDDG